MMAWQAAEVKISTLQQECSQLRHAVAEKESEYQAITETLSTLRTAHEDVTARNNWITENEQRDATNREAMREQYVQQERIRTNRTFESFKAVMSGAHGHKPTIVEEVLQMIGELEEGIETLAAASDAHAVLEAGVNQQVFSCIAAIGHALRVRLLGADDAEGQSKAEKASASTSVDQAMAV